MMSDKKLTRREFLRLMLLAGGTVAISPLLKACSDVPTATTTQSPPQPTATSAPDLLAGLDGLPIDTFFEESFKRLMLRDPESLTLNGVSSLYSVRDEQLTDVSDEYIRQTQAMQTGILALLRKYDRAAHAPEQITSADIYEWQLDDMVRAQPFMYYDYPFTGFVNDVAFNISQLFTEAQPMNNLEDAHAYIARLSQVDAKFGQLLDGLQRREAAGVIVPGLLIDQVLPQLHEITSSNAASTIFFTTFADKVQKINGLSNQDKQGFTDQVEKAIKESVQPGYRKIEDYFKGARAKAPKDLGLWQFPQGAEYYTYLLRHHTSTDLTVDEIHELGLQHAERIQAEMREIFAQLGYPADDSMSALMSRLDAESKMVSGDEALAAYEAAIAKAERMFDQVSDLKPHGKVKVQGGEMGNFFIPMSFDGSRPGIFYANTAYPQPEYQISDIAFHEAIPGHHTQTAIARELILPAMRRVTNLTAYVEGWALYAERLMWELGVYEDDPQGNLGRLTMELLRAVRLVADTGIHAKKWTFDQTAAYMEKTMGYYTEIKRYTAMPGQATAYYIGFLKILELRQKAKDKLGSNFNLKDFHRIVLGNGELPLATLEQLVDAYLANNGA